MSAYEHSLHSTAHKSIQQEKKTPWYVFRWIVAPLRFVLLRPWSCWHRRMSRPFTREGETYRVCVRCGVHRRFDLDAWKTKGSYYFDKQVTLSAAANSSNVKAVPTRARLRLIA